MRIHAATTQLTEPFWMMASALHKFLLGILCFFALQIYHEIAKIWLIERVYNNKYLPRQSSIKILGGRRFS
jgi:hypothetical protein